MKQAALTVVKSPPGHDPARPLSRYATFRRPFSPYPLAALRDRWAWCLENSGSVTCLRTAPLSR